MQLKTKYAPSNKQNFGMALDMNPKKMARKFYPEGGIMAEKLMREIAIAKLVFEARSGNVHTIVIPAFDCDGKPRIDIGIQKLTPKYPKTLNPFKAFLN